MGDRPGHSVRRARGRRFAALLALILCAALVDVPSGWAKKSSSTVTSVTGSATANTATGPVTKSGEGSVLKTGRTYEICVPYFAKGVAHTFEIKSGGTVVDSFTYTVPAADGTVETVTTAKGVKIEIETDHNEGVNGSPSRGCFTYKPPKKSKKAD